MNMTTTTISTTAATRKQHDPQKALFLPLPVTLQDVSSVAPSCPCCFSFCPIVRKSDTSARETSADLPMCYRTAWRWKVFFGRQRTEACLKMLPYAQNMHPYTHTHNHVCRINMWFLQLTPHHRHPNVESMWTSPPKWSTHLDPTEAPKRGINEPRTACLFHPFPMNFVDTSRLGRAITYKLVYKPIQA